MDNFIHIIYFSTFFMFTTVQSFAIAGAKFVQNQIEVYSETYAKKLQKSDESKIKILFEKILSDANVSNYNLLEKDKENLHKELESLGNNLVKKVSKRFTKILSKVRFFTFVFGVHSAIMIFYIALVENKLLSNFDLMSYTCLTSFYFFILPFIYKKFSKNTIKKYVTATSILFLIFFLVILKYENFIVPFFIVSLIIVLLKNKNEYTKYREMIFITLVYSVLLNLIISGFYHYSLREYFLSIYQLILNNEYYYNFISICLFTIVYLIITLIIPVVCFYVRGENLFKQHIILRNKIINKYDSLKIFEEEIENIKSLRTVTNMSKKIKGIISNQELSKEDKESSLSEIITTIIK